MISLSIVLVVAIVCVSIEAFFSGSEIAMVSASRAQLRAKAEAGHRGAILAERYLSEPQVLLSTTLLGTNLAVVTFSVTVSVYLVQGGYGGGELVAVLMVTPITLLLGEVIPKIFFQQRADDLVTRLVYPLHWASLLLRPLVLVVSGYARVVARIFGGDSQRVFVTRKELSLLLEGDSIEAEVSNVEREMISNLLGMSKNTVGHIMLPLSEVAAVPGETTVSEAIRVIADKQHSRMPVYDERVDNIVGVLHVFDLLKVELNERDISIQGFARPVRYVPESFMSSELLVDLQGSGSPMAIVVDEYGGAIGVVTIEDLLEEIVGEIEDEHDECDSYIATERPGVWTILAKAPVEKVNEELNIKLPVDDEYESLAGLILHKLHRLPAVGESLVIDDLTLRVTKASTRSIDEIQLLRNWTR